MYLLTSRARGLVVMTLVSHTKGQGCDSLRAHSYYQGLKALHAMQFAFEPMFYGKKF